MTDAIIGYEKYWKRVYDFVEENDDLSLEELWNRLNWWDLKSPEVWRNEETAKKWKFPFMSDGENEHISLYEIAERKKQFIYDKISEQQTPETDVIIELGAGWGRNIFSLIMLNEHKCKYIMAEPTKSGTDACQLISDRFGLDVSVVRHSFTDDDSKPVIDLIKKNKFKNVIVYTSFAMEQVKELRENFFDDFLQLDLDSLKFTHIEPILKQVETGNVFPSAYNWNLYSILKGLESNNQIKITKVNKNSWKVGPRHASTGVLVAWEKE